MICLKTPQQISSPKLPDPFFRISQAEHRVGNHGKISDVPHPLCERRAAVKVASEPDMILTDELNGAIYDSHPVVNRHSHPESGTVAPFIGNDGATSASTS